MQKRRREAFSTDALAAATEMHLKTQTVTESAENHTHFMRGREIKGVWERKKEREREREGERRKGEREKKKEMMSERKNRERKRGRKCLWKKARKINI